MIPGRSVDVISMWQNLAKNEGNENCSACKSLSYKLNGMRVENQRLENDNEVLKDHVAQLEAQLSTITGATVDIRQQQFIKRLQEIDRTQRTSIAWQARDISALATERDALRALCEKHSIDTRTAPSHSLVSTVNWAAEVEG